MSNSPAAVQPLLRAARAYRAPLAAASTLLLVVSAVWATQAYAHADREESVRVDKAWSEQGAFTYTVPVQRDSPMFRNGTVLGMGEPAYFSSVSPAFDTVFTWKMAEPAASDAHALGALVVQVRSDASDGRALWMLEFPLANASSDAGQPLVLQGHADLAAMGQDVQDGLRALGVSDAKLSWQVLARVAFTFHAPWGEVRDTSSFAMPLTFDGPMYTLPGAEDAQSVHSHGERVVTVSEHRAGLAGVLGATIPLGGLGLGLAGLILLGLSGRPPSGKQGTREAEQVEREMAKFGMWVTEVEGPMEPAPDWGPIVDLNELADLVDMAAEARTRVLLDASSSTFYVITPQACYRYAKLPWLHAAAEAGEPPAPGAAPSDAEPKKRMRWPGR